MIIFCLKILVDCNSFIDKENHLSDARLMQNIVKKRTCNWACIIFFKQLYHLQTLILSFKFAYI